MGGEIPVRVRVVALGIPQDYPKDDVNHESEPSMCCEEGPRNSRQYDRNFVRPFAAFHRPIGKKSRHTVRAALKPNFLGGQDEAEAVLPFFGALASGG